MLKYTEHTVLLKIIIIIMYNTIHKSASVEVILQILHDRVIFYLFTNKAP